jgi:hypothetical protein
MGVPLLTREVDLTTAIGWWLRSTAEVIERLIRLF